MRGRLPISPSGRARLRARAGLASPRPRFGHRVSYVLDGGVTLIGSYHPSQQNTQTGRLTVPMFDSVFETARELLV